MFLLIKKLKIIFLITLSFIIALFVYIEMFHSYKWKDEYKDTDNNGIIDRIDKDVDGDGRINTEDADADGDGINNTDDIVRNARSLSGVLYDYLGGGFNNLGGKLGFLVCYDIPRIAYQQAGIPLDQLLKYDFGIHRNFYNDENGGNTPDNQFFYRRTRNLYAYCEANNKLIKNCTQPKAGDLVFYGKSHIAVVTEVHDDGTYDEMEAAPWVIFSVEHKKKPWKIQNVGRILSMKD